MVAPGCYELHSDSVDRLCCVELVCACRMGNGSTLVTEDERTFRRRTIDIGRPGLDPTQVGGCHGPAELAAPRGWGDVLCLWNVPTGARIRQRSDADHRRRQILR